MMLSEFFELMYVYFSFFNILGSNILNLISSVKCLDDGFSGLYMIDLNDNVYIMSTTHT